MSYRAYAGIGSRQTPTDVLALMELAGTELATRGWVLRSGAAPGADSAFEKGCDAGRGEKEIFVPWSGFEGRQVVALDEPSAAAYETAAKYHPAWAGLKPGVRRLHARNVHQILGSDLEHPQIVKFVLCWTKGASGSGGTGQALRMARALGVEIFDLGDEKVRERIERWLGVIPVKEGDFQPELF